MSALAPAPDRDFNLEQAVDLFKSITKNDHEIALPLFRLFKMVVHPNGDPEKFAIADEIMKRLILLTPEFEEWFRGLVA